MLRKFICQIAFWAFFFSSVAESVQSPFFIPFEPKKDLTEEDILCVQKLISEVSIEPMLRGLYSNLNSKHYTSFYDFLGRCSRGIIQKMIDREKGFYPKKELIKIGKGGNRCLVCSVSVGMQGVENDPRMQLASSIREALENTGFNGHLLTFIGGFPNPTGIEICYAAVPYSFKIFAMVEAYQLGFDNVIWIDSACLPLNDPTSLFDYINIHETLFYLEKRDSNFNNKYIFPQTCAHLMKLTGTDVLRSKYLKTIVFGLKMSSPRVKSLVNQYYDLVKDGYSFLSCFPEEFVLTALINQPEFRSWMKHYKKPRRLFKEEEVQVKDNPKNILYAKSKGYFFYQRQKF